MVVRHVDLREQRSPPEVRELLAVAAADGVTMNPSLVAARGRIDLVATLREFLDLIEGPVFAQVTHEDCEGMVSEARRLAEISERVVVKIPCNAVGLRACRQLAPAGVPVNMTLCFNPMQAVLAARAGARWVSPFIGRLDDAGRDGTTPLKAILSVLRNYNLLSSMSVVAASLRSPDHISAALDAGVHAVTLSPSQILRLPHDPLTEEGSAAFLRDWRNAAETSPPSWMLRRGGRAAASTLLVPRPSAERTRKEAAPREP